MKKNNEKGFTLIELLVVVAIIGILAAVGVVAFNGFLGTSKKNAATSTHKAVVSYMSAEFAKCSLGSTKLKYNKLDGTTQEVDCSGSSGTVAYHQGPMRDHLKASGFKNPYTQQLDLASGAAAPVEGQTVINCGAGGRCTIKTMTVAADATASPAVAAIILEDVVIKE